MSERIPVKKVWNHVIEVKKEFVLKKTKVYLLSREERREECQFIKEQLKKEYIRPLKLPQTATLFFVRNKQKEVNGRGLEVFK